MSNLSIETTFTIVVVITCATSLIGIAALCYVCLSERKRSKQEKEQRLQQRQQQHAQNSTQRNATTDQHANRFSQSLTLPIFTLPDNIGRGSDSKVKGHNASRSGARREGREDSHAASPMVTLSSSFDDDDVYTNGEDAGATLHDASMPHRYPIIRRFSAAESTVGGATNSSNHGNEDEDAASRDMGDDDEDSLDIRTFDDNWSYAMTDEGSQVAMKDMVYGAATARMLKVTKQQISIRKLDSDPVIGSTASVTAIKKPIAHLSALSPISSAKSSALPSTQKNSSPLIRSASSHSSSATSSTPMMRTVGDGNGNVFYEV